MLQLWLTDDGQELEPEWGHVVTNLQKSTENIQFTLALQWGIPHEPHHSCRRDILTQATCSLLPTHARCCMGGWDWAAKAPFKEGLNGRGRYEDQEVGTPPHT